MLVPSRIVPHRTKEEEVSTGKQKAKPWKFHHDAALMWSDGVRIVVVVISSPPSCCPDKDASKNFVNKKSKLKRQEATPLKSHHLLEKDFCMG